MQANWAIKPDASRRQAEHGYDDAGAMTGRKIGLGLAGVVALLVAVAWIDGGREEPRLIEQPVVLQQDGQAQLAAVQGR